jgi:hypothetical protein
MAFITLGQRDEKWQPRKGLEGPFWFVDRVLYYDPIMGQYWDPRTDFYVENAEVDQLQNRLMAVMRAGV